MRIPTTPTIFKNFSFLLSSQIVTWGFTLLLTVCLSRSLGASALGKLHLADSLWAVMAILMAFGLNTVLVKEVARRPASTPELLATTLRLYCLFGIVGLGMLALYVYLAGYALETVHVVYLIGIAGFISQLGEACRAALQGLERMEYMALAAIASKGFMAVISIGLLLMGHGVLLVAAVAVGSALIYLLMQIVALRRLRGFRPSGDESLSAPLLKAGLPYLAMGILLASYQQMDTIIISLLIDEVAVGWYSAANKLSGTFLFIPVLLLTAMFPSLSRMHAEASPFLPGSMRKSFHLSLLLAVPIGLGLVVVADSLVLLLFGDGFAKSGPVLAVMGLAMIFTYQNILLSNFLISMDRQYGLTVLIGLGMLATIPLDIVLVPWCQRTLDNGALGGALSFVITEAGIFVGCLRLLPQGTFGREQARTSASVLIIGLIMVMTTWWLRNSFIVIPIGFGALIYIGLLGLFRLLPQEDWQMLKHLGKDILAKPTSTTSASR